MEKTLEKTKKGLVVCINQDDCDRPCYNCPYSKENDGCKNLIKDALAYIQQLEAANAELLTKVEQLETKCHQLERERDALMHWAKGRCDTCAHNDDCVKHDPDPEGYVMHWYDDCEIWEWRGVKEE